VPKPNGYRSLHTTVFGPDGKATEFQIRTQEMNDEALYGIAAHWHYKEKSSNTENQPRWIKEILELQRNAENTTDFLSKAKIDIFQSRIFIYSPKGDVFELPRDSTPIDFAYTVHSEIGNKAVGVLINDKISQLDHVLKNGDMAEIIVDKNRKGPNKDWLNFVKTAKARDKIKLYSKKSALDNIKKFIPYKK
jgi:GTP pyrophosphokinase